MAKQQRTAAAAGPGPVPDEGLILAAPRRRDVAEAPAVTRAAEALSFGLAWATAGLALLLTACTVGFLFLQVVFRYGLDRPLAWTDEAAIFCFAWTMLLLASLGVRERTHVRFTVIAENLPPRAAAAVDFLIMALIAGFGIALVLTGRELVELVWGNLSPAMHYPLQALYVALPVQGVLLVIHAVTNLLVGRPRDPRGRER